MDEYADPVQPDQGQGEGSAGTSYENSPYSEYLNRIPDEEARGIAEEAFRAWDANYTRRQQEAAEYRNRWQPFENAQPEDIQWGLDMHRAATQNPQAVWDWAQEFAKNNNLVQPPTQNPEEVTYEQWAAQQEERQFSTRLEQQLNPLLQRLEQYDQRWAQMEEQQKLQQAEAYVNNQMETLEREHPDAFKKIGDMDPRQMIETLTGRYIESDPENAVPRAFEDWQNIISQVSKNYAEGKLNQPAPPEMGGGAPVGNEMPRTLAEANAQALAQIRAANRNR